MKIAVAGGGGFIGGHLVGNLLHEGHEVIAIDIKPTSDWNWKHECECLRVDLRKFNQCISALSGCDQVFNLACDMGGIGWIETRRAACITSVLINTHLLMAARRLGVKRYFFSSSACVYAAQKQSDADVTALKESDAFPSQPEKGYGEEKLFSERMCEYFREDYGLETRIARFHNVYGDRCSYKGGREKAPAAICRKVIEAKISGVHEIEIWGDGEQTRSFMWVGDCIVGTKMIMNGRYHDPINLGSNELVSVNQLVSMVESIAGIKLKRRYNLDAPKGVRGRNSDNTLIQSLFGWQPSIKLREGLEKTYEWIYGEITK